MLDREFYGQNGEDYILYSLFSEQPDGFYIDVGAFDGIHLSNSYVFERLGWQGICVEPHPRYFPACQANRPDAICVNAACIGRSGNATVAFQTEELGLLSGIVADKTSDMAQRYAARDMDFKGFETIEVAALCLNDLIEKYAGGRRQVDFISLDTEGNEADILSVFAFEKYDVRIFIVEANNEKEASALVRLMQQHGYYMARQLNQNFFFCRRPGDALLARNKRVYCKIADTLHPLGEQATPAGFRGRVISQNDCWITSNVLCQRADQPLPSLLEYIDNGLDVAVGEKAEIVQVINPYHKEGDPGHESLQARTFSAIDAARRADGSRIKVLSVQFSEEDDVVPDGYTRCRPLDRSIRDVSGLVSGAAYPLLFDILDRAAEACAEDDYIVYTNIDICLRPHFYGAIRELVGLGFDAITINRRTIAENPHYLNCNNLASSDIGTYHPGFDCFVFTKRLYTRFTRNNACLGVAGVARGLLYNMVAHAKRMIMLKNVGLTHHYGDEMTWRSERFSSYTAFNEREYVQTLAKLRAIDEDIAQRLSQFCKQHGEKFLN